MINENNKKVPCGGFYLGDGLTMDGNTLKSLGGEQVQSDYAQNDPTAKDYIKNRPFYTGDPVETVLVEESTVDFAAQGGMYSALWPDSSANFEAVEGQAYTVYFDGVPYNCVAKLIQSLLIIGNAGLLGGEDTGEPFIIIKNGSKWGIATTDTSPSHVLSISGMVSEIKQIDSKYLPIASDDEYGAVKRSKIITSYVFSNDVKVSQMKKAIDDFNNGSARIKWKGDIVISARYEDDGTLYIVFSSQPYRTMSMTSDTVYQKDLLIPASSSEGIMERLRISSLDSVSVEGVIDCNGSSNLDRTINIGAEHLNLGAADIRMYSEVLLNRKELILQSSTDRSKKKFKITVDDTGAIKATEVTT